jgi:hypothetical protein
VKDREERVKERGERGGQRVSMEERVKEEVYCCHV